MRTNSAIRFVLRAVAMATGAIWLPTAMGQVSTSVTVNVGIPILYANELCDGDDASDGTWPRYFSVCQSVGKFGATGIDRGIGDTNVEVSWRELFRHLQLVVGNG